jgi:Arc/MetJ family transcription regulator
MTRSAYILTTEDDGEEVVVSTTMIDLDDDALEQARQYYHTSTKKDTVNRALQDAARRRAEQLSALGDFLLESAAEYEQMTDADKAEFRSLMDTTDRKYEAQIAQIDRARADEGQ